MNTYRPLYSQKYVPNAILCYLLSLVAVSLYFSNYVLEFQWWVFGIAEVCGFFYFSHYFGMKWMRYTDEQYAQKLFRTALIIRLVWVVFSYFYYQWMTGDVWEYGCSDSKNYHSRALWIIEMFETNNLKEYWKFLTEETDDAGYASYLALVCALTNNSILIPRLLKAVWGAWTCLLIYRLANRQFGGEIARVAGVVCMTMPNLIYYCGLHLKETEMVFLCVLFVERADMMLRSKKFTAWQVGPVLLIAASLFTLRTPLAIVAILSLLFAVVMSSSKVVGWSKRIAVGILSVILVLTIMGNRIEEQTRALYEQVSSGQQEENMAWRTKREGGNEFAKYAGAAVFAPMIFTIPFPTMVETPGQENQKIIHGGNWCKNILSYFMIIAVVLLIAKGDWRKHALPLAFMIGYLIVLIFSNFAQSERFHMPVLAFELLFVAYGMEIVRQRKLLKVGYGIWCLVMVVAAIAWSWFKLAGRGMA